MLQNSPVLTEVVLLTPRPRKAARRRPLNVRTAVWLFLVACLASCERGNGAPAPPTSAAPSPNASILPAPLGSGAALLPSKQTSRPASPKLPDGDGGVLTAIALHELGPAPEVEEASEDKTTPHETVLLSLDARFAWQDPWAPRYELAKWAKSHSEFAFRVDMANSRLRVTLDSDAFVLSRGTEFRSRADHLGHLLLWPDGKKFRILTQGTLRALFSERRADVGPLTEATEEELEPGHYLGKRVTRKRLATPTGALLLEQVRAPTVAWGGALLCRFLVELVSAATDTTACARGLVPVRATFTWPSGRNFFYRVNAWQEQLDAAADTIDVPPARAELATSGLPESSPIILLPELQTQLRPGLTGNEPPSREHPAPPSEGLRIENRERSVRYVAVGGVGAAWVLGNAHVLLSGVKAGQHAVTLSDFFGDEPSSQTAVAPGVVVIGKPPAAKDVDL